MKKLFNEVITSKVILLWFIISAIIFILFFYNYQNKIENDGSIQLMYSISDYNNEQELNELTDDILLQRNELDENNSEYKNNYKYLDNLLKIYKELQVTNINYSDVNQNIPGTYTANQSSFIINAKTIIYTCTIILVFLLVYIVFTREFDSSIYMFIYSKDRIKPIIERFMVILVVALLYYLFMFSILYITSLSFESVYNYILVVDSNRCYFIETNHYLFQYVVLNSIYIIIFCTTTIFSLVLLCRKTINLFGGIFILLVIVSILDFFTNFLSFIGLSFNLNEVNMSKVAFDIYWIYLIIPMLLFGFSLQLFKRADL